MRKARRSWLSLCFLIYWPQAGAGHFCVVVCHLDVRAAAKDKQTVGHKQPTLFSLARWIALRVAAKQTVNAPGNVFSTHAPAGVWSIYNARGHKFANLTRGQRADFCDSLCTSFTWCSRARAALWQHAQNQLLPWKCLSLLKCFPTASLGAGQHMLSTCDLCWNIFSSVTAARAFSKIAPESSKIVPKITRNCHKGSSLLGIVVLDKNRASVYIMLLLEKLSWGWVPNNVWHKNLSVEIYDRLCRCDNRFLASPS